MAVILIVEDDADNKDLVTRFLKREGHSVLHAEDGEAGVTEIQNGFGGFFKNFPGQNARSCIEIVDHRSEFFCEPQIYIIKTKARSHR